MYRRLEKHPMYRRIPPQLIFPYMYSMETASIDVDIKIREIQMTARHAREIEKGESSPSEGSELDEQIPNEMHLVERDTVEGLKDSIWSDVLEKQASNVLSFIGEDVSEEHVEGDMNLTNNVLSEALYESHEAMIYLFICIKALYDLFKFVLIINLFNFICYSRVQWLV